MQCRAIDRKSLVVVGVILGAAVILRCFFLSKQSLWLDECVSWFCSVRGLSESLHCDINKPPLYYPLLYLWGRIFGFSEASMRAFSIPPGIASVWIVYLLSQQLFSRPVALLAATYQAVAPFQIYFAQEARNYTWMEFFLLLGGLFLWQALEAKSQRWRLQYWAAYCLSITLALYTHYFSAFFIAGHGLYVLFRKPRRLLGASLSVTGALAMIAPPLMVFLRSPQSSEAHLHHFPLLKFPQAYFSFIFGDSLIPMDEIAVKSLLATLRANAGLVAVALATVAVLAYFCLVAWRRWREPIVYCAFHAAVPVVIAFLVSQKLSFFDRRYVIPASPYVYMLAAAAWYEAILVWKNPAMPAWKSWCSAAAAGSFTLLLSISLYQYYFGARFGKEQWRDAVAYVEASSSPDGKDLVMLDPDFVKLCWGYYHKRNLPTWVVTTTAEDEAVHSEDVLRDHTRGFHKVWLVYSHNQDYNLLTALRHLYSQETAREFPLSNRIEIYSFRVDGRNSTTGTALVPTTLPTVTVR